jgi:hypothetical protein
MRVELKEHAMDKLSIEGDEESAAHLKELCGLMRVLISISQLSLKEMIRIHEELRDQRKS